jgi:hypothetical protein
LVPVLLLFDVTDKVTLKQRIIGLSTWHNLLTMSVLAGLLFAPQLYYNHYAFGTWGIDSYQDEGFRYISQPKIIEVLFAPNNGLLLYAPLLVITTAVAVLFRKKGDTSHFLPLILFIIYTLLYACWWSYMLGCGLGHRGFVELLPVYAVLLTIVLQHTRQRWLLWLLVACCVYTTKLTFSHDGCFYGTHDWDWAAFEQLLLGKTK